MNPRDLMSESYMRLFRGASDTMKAAMCAGLPLEFTSERVDGGVTITATTKYPCALVGDTLYYKKTE